MGCQRRAIGEAGMRPATSAGASTRPAPGVTVELTDNSLLVGDQVTLATGEGPIGAARWRVAGDSQPRHSWPAISPPERRIAETMECDCGNVLVRRSADRAQSANARCEPRTFGTGARPIGRSCPRREFDGVTFEFDGERINVPLEKVEGILLHHRQAESWPDPICRVRDVTRRRMACAIVANSTNGKLHLQTVAGVRGELPWDRVSEIDFTAGNLVFLSDLKPESFEWRPYLVTPATPPALAKWFSLRRDKNTDGSVLTLAGQSYEKGLSVHSRSLLSYRLTKDYRHFQAMAGIDERFRGPANLEAGHHRRRPDAARARHARQ